MTLAWVHSGQNCLEAALMADVDVTAPSALPGWTRGHVLTHLARNADALANLLDWARTGVPTPMYASPGQRAADIAAGADRPLAEQVADVRASAHRFAETAAALSADQWSARVRSGMGRDIPAGEVPWLRAREVWLHLVDLDVGATVDDIPDPVAAALVRDVAGWLTGRVDLGVDLRPIGHDPVRLGTGDAVAVVSGPANRIAGWLTGRASPDVLDVEGTAPELPQWL